MKTRLYLTFPMFFALLFISSCDTKKNKDTAEVTIENKEQPPEEADEAQLYDEVMAIHDEVMPKTDDMMLLKRQLQTKLDSARANEAADNAQNIENAIKNIDEADEAMMQWMRGFKPQDDIEDHDQVMQYYKDQKEEMLQVKEMMLSAIEEANDLIKND